ncbi:hypothetical protein AUEXF2481DRAFT_6992 [Aureobasidium subglaciale EXF-2481]|uniref:Uncharacterized protein n=1 Tax=Aureobasidium subglaciale (strain EXF-2481) TaxID=1043005 RepID=A0A074Y5F9_AURSE|nr:uncharacterized protein AUEXF2481DRAFT_6992 [Aureobasidium subglaciale EXF-2481]KAI5195620.1 hypothetical protein E4T38_08940 [Aureobasidium subglaciale]KAI5214622.1 hypothetical protein E4T40_08914 [Aureobasidium subglaciale]KAI5217405.1 hypothetical protein E4T41_08873 [Aureobasidium subglaciale]KAI5255027.1 hypothetical protein E4T46_08907 [Aureobasidium subglaciale]KEQ93033.1 hypothetical protein AUEXF2481DRAFT_6992 [Aureobasidium subglaciale EXF-2481]
MEEAAGIPLLQTNSCGEDFAEEKNPITQMSRGTLKERYWVILWMFISMLMTSVLWAIVLAVYLHPARSNQTIYEQSPVAKLASLKQHEHLIDGSLYSVYESTYKSYINAPSRDVDALWDGLSAEGSEVVLMDGESVKFAGFDLAKLVKAPANWTTRTGDLYPVQIDVFHQIHCLDEVRKQMHAWHYYPELNSSGFAQKTSPTFQHWQHKNHCLSILLQNIICHADLDMVPHRWTEWSKLPFAQFSIKKRCTNLDALLSWNKENALSDIKQKWSTIQRPESAYVWPGYGEIHPDN